MTIRPHRPLTGLVLAALLLTACAGPTRTARPPAVTPPDNPPQAAAPVADPVAPPPVTAPVAADPTGEGQPTVVPPSSTGALTARPEYTSAVAARDVNAPTTARRDPAAMTVDLVVARPAGAVATVAGAAIFLVSWPFAALGGNTDETWGSLVVDPASYTFQRPLGDFDHERPHQPATAP